MGHVHWKSSPHTASSADELQHWGHTCVEASARQVSFSCSSSSCCSSRSQASLVTWSSSLHMVPQFRQRKARLSRTRPRSSSGTAAHQMMSHNLRCQVPPPYKPSSQTRVTHAVRLDSKLEAHQSGWCRRRHTPLTDRVAAASPQQSAPYSVNASDVMTQVPVSNAPGTPHEKHLSPEQEIASASGLQGKGLVLNIFCW